MSATTTSSWQNVTHRKTVSLTVYLISVAVLVAALAVTLAVSLAARHSSTGPGNVGKPSPSAQDECNIRPVGAYC